jgi:hypothetical protein
MDEDGEVLRLLPGVLETLETLTADLQAQSVRVKKAYERNGQANFADRLEDLADLGKRVSALRAFSKRVRGIVRDRRHVNGLIVARLEAMGDPGRPEGAAAWLREPASDLAARLRFLGSRVPAALDKLAEEP